ncbi:hypothetical protein [Streptosporangium pseudovulgare]|uniref:Gram-positive cocci surface proteins LPxTG domain-containing protein n=1 Tax=Streptosporangium pseudovulgare TaxID=35765 RepID=A0ABQ2R1B0_9ACTN|nr:hypothetical protein [Streptosporangium pseudovulgare]GGQ03913.1 hypothetical protein GCM10010140_37490 [Streptosporangium pseudovulgare]
MLESRTRRRVAAKMTAIAVAGAGVLFGAVPAIASLVATPKPVTYTCTALTGGGASASHTFQVELAGPATAPTPSSAAVVTLKIGSPAPALAAPTAFGAGDRIAVDADVVVTGSPLPSLVATPSAQATTTSGVVASGGSITSFPTMLVTVTPTATGVFAVRPDSFTLLHVPAAATGTGAGTENALYDCVAEQTSATGAAVLVTVQATSTGTGTPTSTPTSTPTPTPTPTETATETPDPVVTITTTRTAGDDENEQIEKTPGGGASTGGGGEAGPDARVIMLGGVLMAAGAAAGGLMLRRRTATRG